MGNAPHWPILQPFRPPTISATWMVNHYNYNPLGQTQNIPFGRNTSLQLNDSCYSCSNVGNLLCMWAVSVGQIDFTAHIFNASIHLFFRALTQWEWRQFDMRTNEIMSLLWKSYAQVDNQVGRMTPDWGWMSSQEDDSSHRAAGWCRHARRASLHVIHLLARHALCCPRHPSSINCFKSRLGDHTWRHINL